MSSMLFAGAAATDITPRTPQRLYGYPHVERCSTGVHDPLLASALCLENGGEAAVFVSVDTIFICRETARRTRNAISEGIGISADRIMVGATHTHSAPLAIHHSRRDIETDAPEPDPGYVAQLEQGIIAAAVEAYRKRQPAVAGLAVADATGTGTHRHDPKGPADFQMPVLTVRSQSGNYLAAMMVCSMHPTVLHEDSTLISGDFPGLARLQLQSGLLGSACPVLHFTGPAGNQSPRHVTRGNTIAEAKRLGGILADAVRHAITDTTYTSDLHISSRQTWLELPARSFPSVDEARANEQLARQRLADLRCGGAPRTQVRSAECDWFGAEEALACAESFAAGRLAAAREACLPAEVQVIGVGDWKFVGWPCEIFVEFALEVKARHPDTFVISLANGELRGYLVTEEAVRNKWYEAGNALMQSPESGTMLVAATEKLLKTNVG